MRKSMWAAGAAMAALGFAGQAMAQTASSPFSTMVVFGDSLSDTGNVATLNGMTDLNSFTTNPGLVTVEVVGGHYGLPLLPSLKGGTNVAYGGAGVVNNAFGTAAGIPTLTAQVNGYLAANPRLNPTGLYTFFGGGNDVNFAATNLTLGALTLPQATAQLQAAGTQALTLIGSLQAAGAKTIIVVNSPNVGQTPSAKSSNAIVPGNSDRIAGLAQAYNAVLDAGLAGKTGIVPVNAYKLLDETIANPAAFGLTNVTDTACTTSSSLTCTTSTLKAPNADKTWLFADGIHPTTAGHNAFGNYILSELAAPQQISLLAEVPLSISATHRAVIGQELAAGAENGMRFFGHASYSGAGYDRQGDIQDSDSDGFTLTTGSVFSPIKGLTAGWSTTTSRTDTDFGSGGGGFETQVLLLSIFASHQIGEHGYLTGDAYAADLDFNDIDRIVDLGGPTRIERGDSGGSASGFSLGGGYWFKTGGLDHGPFASVTSQNVRVSAYGEGGADSTAMTFGRQERESLVSEIGWQVKGTTEMAGAKLAPYASVAYANESKDDVRQVSAGLVTMNGTFSMAGFAPSDSYVSLKAGVGIMVTEKYGASIGYFGRVGDNAQDQHGVTLAIRGQF